VERGGDWTVPMQIWAKGEWGWMQEYFEGRVPPNFSGYGEKVDDVGMWLYYLQ